MTQPLLTHSSAKIAALFLNDPGKEKYGLELVRDAGSTKGTVYPMLAGWQRRGWVTERDETDAEMLQRGDSGSRRKYYRLTTSGLTALTEYLTRWDARQSGARVQI